jgi:hypothetical protein
MRGELYIGHEIGWLTRFRLGPIVLTLLRVQEATAKMVDVIAAIAFQKKVDEVCRAVPVARRARVCMYCLIVMLLWCHSDHSLARLKTRTETGWK